MIEVVSTYERATSLQLTIGKVLTGGYPLSPRFMLWAYRSVAREPEVLEAAIAGDKQLMALSGEQIEARSVPRALADSAINDEPALPWLEGALAREELREPLTLIARARIASTMKSIGYCASKELVPLFDDGNINCLVGIFTRRATQVIDRLGEEDPYWINRHRALNVSHNEYLNYSILSEMPVDDVLKLRSIAWGEQAEARDQLLRTAAELAHEALTEDDFDNAIRTRLQLYRARAEAVQRQRSNLSFHIKCELIKGAGGVAMGGAGATTASGTLTQMQTALGAGTLLLAGCLWAVNRIQELKPASDQLRSA